MAIVKELRAVTKDRVGRPSETACGFAAVEIDGVEYLVLESYGSDQREKQGKISQSFHFDREHAAALKKILDRYFPGI